MTPGTVHCACGECGLDPTTWGCEAKDDPQWRADAYWSLSSAAERRGADEKAVEYAKAAEALTNPTRRV